MAGTPWKITINSWDGLVPGFWTNSLAKGNSGQASDLQNVDLTDPNVLTQGPGLANLTNGTEAGAITTLIRGSQKISNDGTNAYAVGGNQFYQFTSAAVTNTGSFPHTINKAVVTAEDGEDVCEFQGNYYYSYNHSGTAGDIGKFDGTSTFDDDYMSTTPSGATTLFGDVPHQMIAAGNDKMYITNGRYIASWNGTTFTDQDLDLPTGEVINSITWNHNRIYASSNKPNTTSSVQAQSSIYVWDTTSTSWEYQITVRGKIGALFSRGGIVFCWYQDITSTGGFKLGIVDGTQIQDIAFYTGSLPLYYQVDDHKNHLIWISSGEIWAWGAVSNDLPAKLWQFADAGHATAGGLTNAFGTPMVASFDASTAYRFAKFSGYDVTAQWKSILFDVSDGTRKTQIDRVVVFTEPLSTGAKVDTTLTYDYAKSSLALDQVAYSATVDTTRHIIQRNSVQCENFRLDLAWANGSATNPVKIRKIEVTGHFIDNR